MKEQVQISVTDRFILLKMKKDEQDIRFVKSLNYSRWDQASYCWVISKREGNLQHLKDYFGERLAVTEVDEQESDVVARDRIQTMERGSLTVVRYHSGRIRLIFRYDKEFIALVKTLPFCQWDAVNRWWTVAHTEKILKMLIDFCEQKGWKYQYLEDMRLLNRKPRLKPEEVLNYRQVPTAFLEKLTILRYSENTIRTYRDCFSEFINYYSTKDINQITQEEIHAYLLYLVEKRQVSTSYQNQAINAIKFYYEKVLKGPRRIYLIERPRKERILPTVLSESEVKRIIECITNIKHKCLIMTCYSGGLRISEALNLKPSDIDSMRMMIHVRGGKGKKDRITLLSVRLLELLREYYRLYKPGEYLFTGQMGGQYSEKSAQAVLKLATRKAGIQKRVTLHTLRHSFATHLLENGTDLRYIQSLLGHASPKTTQIYTHITTKGFDQIKNPLDSMGI